MSYDPKLTKQKSTYLPMHYATALEDLAYKLRIPQSQLIAKWLIMKLEEHEEND